MVQAIGLAAHAPRVPNLRRNIAFLPKRRKAFRLIAVISTARLSDLLRRSYLPLAAISGIIAFLPAFAGAFIDYYKRSPKSRLYTKFLQNFCTSLQNCCEAPPPPPAQAKAAAGIPLLSLYIEQPLDWNYSSNRICRWLRASHGCTCQRFV